MDRGSVGGGTVSSRPATGLPETGFMVSHRPRRRLRGVDAARAVAVLGMVMVHFGPFPAPDTALGNLYGLSHGRASVLFALLAGVGVALLTAGRSGGRTSLTRGRLVLRGALLLPLGLWLQDFEHGALVILQYYGIYFVFVAFVLTLPDRWLLAGGAAVLVAGPLVYLWGQAGVAGGEARGVARPRVGARRDRGVRRRWALRGLRRVIWGTGRVRVRRPPHRPAAQTDAAVDARFDRVGLRRARRDAVARRPAAAGDVAAGRHRSVGAHRLRGPPAAARRPAGAAEARGGHGGVPYRRGVRAAHRDRLHPLAGGAPARAAGGCLFRAVVDHRTGCPTTQDRPWRTPTRYPPIEHYPSEGFRRPTRVRREPDQNSRSLYAAVYSCS